MHLDNINSVDLAPQLKLLFEEEMLPVGAGAQKKVPVPAELDLETDICHYESSSEEEAEEESDDSGGEYGQGGASEAWNYQKLAAQFATKAGGAVHGAGNTYILKEDFSKKAAMLLKQAEVRAPWGPGCARACTARVFVMVLTSITQCGPACVCVRVLIVYRVNFAS